MRKKTPLPDFDTLFLIGLAFAFLAGGCLLGWLVGDRVRRGKVHNTQAGARQIIANARQEAEDLKKTTLLEARDEWRRTRGPLEKEQESQKRALRNLETNLLERDQQLDRKVDVLERKERSHIKIEQELERREGALTTAETLAQEMVRQQSQRLEELAGISQQEARRMLIDQLEQSARQFAARKVREIKDTAIATASLEAKEIITRAIQRFAGELAVESTISVIPIPSDDMKGRIIGRDGRNIRSFEMITGVEVIVDDTPGMVMLSGFDSLRREVAKNTLEKLILDGRIHPGRIEEVYEKANEDVEEMIRESGSKAAFDLGIHDLAEPLLEALGKLRFRTSYGQNLLAHSKEVGLLAGMMAEMLDLDVPLPGAPGCCTTSAKRRTSSSATIPSKIASRWPASATRAPRSSRLSKRIPNTCPRARLSPYLWRPPTRSRCTDRVPVRRRSKNTPAACARSRRSPPRTWGCAKPSRCKTARRCACWSIASWSTTPTQINSLTRSQPK